jgi:acyl carrier protein
MPTSSTPRTPATSATSADFKVPSEIVVVDAIPAGATGKVRRADLAQALAAARTRATAGPRDAIESALVALVAGVLGVEEVGIDDNFFALGGDSIKGMELAMQLESALGAPLGAAAVFRHPSVRELAQAVRASRGGATA